jgi:cardiolipin synthase
MASTETGLRLLQGSTEFFPALAQALNQARHEVFFETYLFDVAADGVRIASALEQAALRGVRVMVVVDGAGSRDLAPEWLDRWGRAGVQWRVFEPLGAGGIWFPSRWRRLHRKLCVVDADKAFCGGINVLDDWYDPHTQSPLPHPRLDYAVEMTGPVVADVKATMSQLWFRLEMASTLRERRLSAALDMWREGDWGRVSLGMGSVRLVLRDNLSHRRDIQRSYLKAIGRAKKDILIANAFFLPISKMRRALEKAADRGVKVRLVLPGHYEYAVPYRASRVVYRQLIRAGVEILEYHASYLHAKVAVMDDQWATVGSSNLDPLSLLLAREANLVIEDTAFAVQMRQRLEQACERGAHAVLPRMEVQPWWDRWLDRLAYVLMRSLIFLTARRY